jgi:hypothetical protein
MEGRVRPKCVVVSTQTTGEQLCLGSSGEQLSVEELAPEPAVERFCKAVLLWGSRLDVGGAGGVAGPAPVT